MLVRKAEPQIEHVGTDRRIEILSGRVALGDTDEFANLLLQDSRQSRHIRDAAEVHEVHRLGRVSRHAIDGSDELLGIELRRCRCRCDEGAAWRIHFPIRNAKGIARENARGGAIDDGVVMQRMSRCMYELALTAPETKALTILRDLRARGRNRDESAV